MITEDQVRIYQLLTDLIWKSIFAFVVLAAFVAVLVMLILAHDWQTTLTLSFLEAVFSGTLFVVFKHYFPERKKSKD